MLEREALNSKESLLECFCFLQILLVFGSIFISSWWKFIKHTGFHRFGQCYLTFRLIFLLHWSSSNITLRFLVVFFKIQFWVMLGLWFQISFGQYLRQSSGQFWLVCSFFQSQVILGGLQSSCWIFRSLFEALEFLCFCLVLGGDCCNSVHGGYMYCVFIATDIFHI